jgi:outer membrane immunogenic protein
MTKQIKTLIAAAMICSSLFSSTLAHAQLSVGARAGINFATEPIPDYYHVFLARPQFGIFGQYNFHSPLAVQVGLTYSGEGANYRDDASGDTYHVRHAFLNIPLWIQYKLPVGFYIEAGPQFGLLLSGKESDNSGEYTDTKKYYKGTDFGAGIGLGYEFPKNALKGFGLNVRYIRGLSAINKDPIAGNDIKTRVLGVGLTYRFKVGAAR